MVSALARLVKRTLAWLGHPGLRRGALAGLFVLALAAAPAGLPLAEASGTSQAADITLTARAGLDGYYKESRWVPLRITVANDGPDVAGLLRVEAPRFNSNNIIVTRAVELPTQSRRELFLYIPTEGFISSLKTTLLVDGQERATATVRVVQASANDLIFGVLAGLPSAYTLLADVDPMNGSAYVAQLEAGDLPPVAYAWHSLDVLVVSDADTGVLSAEQRSAMAGWVAAGGRLIVAGGPTWQRTAAGLGGLLPLAPVGTQTLTDLSGLASYAAAAAPNGAGVAAVGALSDDAAVLASAGDVPLVIVRRSGYGQVTYLALDPAFDPLRGWDGVAGLFRNVLAGTAQRPNWAGGMRNWYSARDAVNALPGLDFPSAFQICGFLGLYLVAVGPVNYFVLKRLKRRELAWLTIPGLVLIFSAGAYLTGYQLRGAQASLHRLAVVQVWPDADFARVEGVVGLFSPRRTAYDLSFGGGFLARPMPVDTYGAPGATFTVEQADAFVIPDVRLEVGAVEPFVVQGQVPAPQFEADLVLDVSSAAGKIHGTLINRSDLTLLDAVLLGPGTVDRLGDLAPGASVNVSLSLLNARAAVAPANDVLPALAGQVSAFPPTWFTPSTYDSTIDDILGNTYYYNDREQFRRYSLLSSMIDSYSGNVRGGGVYLAGWTDSSPVPAEVVGRSFDTIDRTLYLVALPPKLDLGEGEVVIPPALMQWTPLNTNPSTSPTPYDMYLYQGNEFLLRFAPAQVVPYTEVEALTLHLTSYGLNGTASVDIAVWDFSEEAWVELPPVLWGDTDLPQPARFVGPGGQIQVRIQNGGQLQVSVERLDFTLTASQ